MLLQLVILSPCLFGLAFPQARVPSQKLPEPCRAFGAWACFHFVARYS
jgi:hypothetical protein